MYEDMIQKLRMPGTEDVQELLRIMQEAADSLAEADAELKEYEEGIKKVIATFDEGDKELQRLLKRDHQILTENAILRGEMDIEKPLSVQQLLHMDGLPVWVEFLDGSGGLWGIVWLKMFNRIIFPTGNFCTIGEPLYGKSYLPYRCPPMKEQATRCDTSSQKEEPKVLFYELVNERPDVLGSDTQSRTEMVSKDWGTILAEYKKDTANTLRRTVRIEGGKIRKEVYDPETGTWM